MGRDLGELCDQQAPRALVHAVSGEVVCWNVATELKYVSELIEAELLMCDGVV